MSLAATVLGRLDRFYPAAADPDRAAGARAYMRDQFPFLGIARPRLTALDKEVLAGLEPPTEADLVAIALGCWERAEREYQYFACGYLRRYIKVASADLLAHRALASGGEVLVGHSGHAGRPHRGTAGDPAPRLVATMDAWIDDENLWLARTAILHQLRYKEHTDAERLFRYCRAQSAHRDFFIRKAIGWALREYAKTDPVAVTSFVRSQESQLSPLSVREALKNIDSR
jgi:3-methyladenine DNA glycosylase AlkD